MLLCVLKNILSECRVVETLHKNIMKIQSHLVSFYCQLKQILKSIFLSCLCTFIPCLPKCPASERSIFHSLLAFFSKWEKTILDILIRAKIKHGLLTSRLYSLWQPIPEITHSAVPCWPSFVIFTSWNKLETTKSYIFQS